MRAIIILVLLILCATSVFGLQASILQTSPAPAQAGEYVDVTVRLSVQTNQETLQGVTLDVGQSPYLSLASDVRSYSSIRPGDQITSTLRVYIEEQTPEGRILFPIVVRTNSGSLTFNEELYVRGASRIADLRIGQILSTPEQILPDSQRNRIRVSLRNIGEQDAELLSASLVLDEQASPSFAYSLQDSLASLAGGSQEDLEFYLDIEEDARESIQGILELEYRTRLDGSRTPRAERASLPVTIPIDNAPFLRIASQELLSESVQGSSDNTLRVTLENTGSEEAVDARVRLFPDISYPFIFEQTSQYVGARILPGANASFDVNYEVLEDADIREYEISVELESLVDTSRYAQDDVISIPVRQGGGFGVSSAAWLIVLGALVLAGVLAYTKRKNK